MCLECDIEAAELANKRGGSVQKHVPYARDDIDHMRPVR